MIATLCKIVHRSVLIDCLCDKKNIYSIHTCMYIHVRTIPRHTDTETTMYNITASKASCVAE